MDNPVATPFEQAHHDRMIEQRLAIVVGSSADAEALRPFVHPGVMILHLGTNPCGVRFDSVVMLVKPRLAHEKDWFANVLVTRMAVGAKMTWLAPQWEIEPMNHYYGNPILR